VNILLCCEHFHPSVGGVQKVMLEIGLRFKNKEHNVTVVTSWRADRNEDDISGINIKSFEITGNDATTMKGDISDYQAFLIESKFDFLLVMAAQQWTLDAMLPILDKIPYIKMHIPCGYSSFYKKKYKKYYRNMHVYLNKFDQLIYNSSDYRDINYAKNNGLNNINIIPAGASEFEFMNPPEKLDREELDIDKNNFIFLTVGTPAFNKGHSDIIRSYLLSGLPFKSTLILNGNYDEIQELRFKSFISKPIQVLREIAMRLQGRSPYNIMKLAKNNNDSSKNIIFTNLERPKLIQLFFEADLFLFASHVEYSPLVIFECLASGLPFISTAVGNVDEIVQWSNGGVICNSIKTKNGNSHVDPKILSSEITALSTNREQMHQLSINGRLSWKERFTYEVIANQIEVLAATDQQ